MKQSIESVLDEYLNYELSMERFVQSTANAVRSDFRGLLRFMKQRGIEPELGAFTTRVVSDYLASNRKRVEGATLKRWYKSLSGFGRWAENNDYIQRNPLARVDLGFVATHRREFMFPSTDDARRFLTVPVRTDLIPEVDRLFRSLLLFAGLRRNEVLKLCWSCVDWEQRELRIYDSKATRKKNLPDLLDRNVPVCPSLFDALASAYRVAQPKPEDPVVWRKPGRSMSKDAFYSAFHAVAQATGMPTDSVPHFLRHNLASSLTGLGATAVDVALLLGHRNCSSDRPTTTDGYLTSSLVRVRSFVEAYGRLVTGERPVPPDKVVVPTQLLTAPVAVIPRDAATGHDPRFELVMPRVASIDGVGSGQGDSMLARRVVEAAELWLSLVPGGNLTDPEFHRFLRAVSGQPALGSITGLRNAR